MTKGEELEGRPVNCAADCTVASSFPLSPSTPTQPTSKRTRRQSKITDVFSVGRRSARGGGLLGKGELLASPTLRKKPERGLGVGKDLVAGSTTEEIVKNTSPLVGLLDDDEEGEGEGDAKVLVEMVEKYLEPIKPKAQETLPRKAPEEPIVIHEDLPTVPVALGSKRTSTALEPTLTVAVDDLPAVPAYQRYAHLLAGPRPFPLPSKFLVLEKILGALDSICMLSVGRDQAVVFHKTIKSLESSVGRRVEVLHLQQIISVFHDPELGEETRECYSLRPVNIVHYGKRVKSFIVELPQVASHDYLLGRRTEFVKRLTAKMTAHHDIFLKSINVTLPPGAKLRTWHPKFDVEAVPDLDAVELFPPNLPTGKGKGEDKGKGKDEDEGKDGDSPSTEGSLVPEDPLTEHQPKKVESLLERIKAKQKAADLAKMSHDPIKEALRGKYEELFEFTETVAM